MFMSKLSFLITGLLCFLAVSLSAQSVVGKWKYEFQTDQGTMVMSANIKADGTYELDYGIDGTVDVTGKYTISGDEFTIQDETGNCTGKGVYKVKVDETTMTMTLVSDECEGRGGPEGVMVSKRM